MFRVVTIALALTLAGNSIAAAQDFGIMESAETIDQGNF